MRRGFVFLLLCAPPARAESIQRAAFRGDAKAVRAALEAGTAVDATDGSGTTALGYASGHGHKQVVALLLEAGADPVAANKAGMTPLHLAAQEGHAEVLALLLAKVRDVNPLNDRKQTPLDLAVRRGHARIRAELLKRGGRPGKTLKGDPVKGLTSPDAAARAQGADRLARQGEAIIGRLLAMPVEVAAPVFWRMGAEAETALLERKPSRQVLFALGALPGMSPARVTAFLKAMSDPELRGDVLDLFVRTGWRLRSRPLEKPVALRLRDELLIDLESGVAPAAHAAAAIGLKDPKLRRSLARLARARGGDATLRRNARWALQAGQGEECGRHAPKPVPRRNQAEAEAIRRGLEMLAARQKPDGHWATSGDRTNYDIAVTGLALAAYLGPSGVRSLDPVREPRAQVVVKGLLWLLNRQGAQGRFGGGPTRSAAYAHAFATYALAGARVVSGDPLYDLPLKKAVDSILESQTELGWGYPRMQNTTSVTICMAAALKRAWFGGVAISGESFDRACEWIEKMTDPESGQVGYNLPGGSVARFPSNAVRFPKEKSQAMTAAGIRLRLLAGEDPKGSPAIKKGSRLCLKLLPVWDDRGHIDMIYWWHASEAFGSLGGSRGRTWAKALRALALRRQLSGGGWPPDGAWGGAGGDIYATSMMIMSLQAGLAQ